MEFQYQFHQCARQEEDKDNSKTEEKNKGFYVEKRYELCLMVNKLEYKIIFHFQSILQQNNRWNNSLSLFCYKNFYYLPNLLCFWNISCISLALNFFFLVIEWQHIYILTGWWYIFSTILSTWAYPNIVAPSCRQSHLLTSSSQTQIASNWHKFAYKYTTIFSTSKYSTIPMKEHIFFHLPRGTHWHFIWKSMELFLKIFSSFLDKFLQQSLEHICHVQGISRSHLACHLVWTLNAS